MAKYQEWSRGWIEEGHYFSYVEEGVTYYERCIKRDLAHYEWNWTSTVNAVTESGPVVPDYLEITEALSKEAMTNQIWQFIFGIKGQVYIYIQLPTDLKRHGLPARMWPDSAVRRVAHFKESMSPYSEPTFLTEHFLKRVANSYPDFTVYNPNSIALEDIALNFFINKMLTQVIGTAKYTEQGLKLTPSKSYYTEILDRLHKQLVPCRPISLDPVRAAANAP